MKKMVKTVLYEMRACLLIWTMGPIILLLLAVLLVTGRLRVKGRKNLAKTGRRNRFLIPNHPSFMDPLLVPFALFIPSAMLLPWKYFPWQTPNEQFIKNARMPFLRWAHTIMIKTTESGQVRDPTAIGRISEALKTNTLIIFPEGTRSSRVKAVHCQTPSGITLGKPKIGIGVMAYQERPVVLPVLIKGAEKVLRPTSLFPNFFRSRIEIIVGKPVYYGEFLKMPPEKETYRELAAYFMDAIAELDN